MEQSKTSSDSASKLEVSPVSTGNGMSMAMRMSTDMVSTIFVGGGIGYLIDYWSKTGPWFTIVFFLFGTAAGFRNIYRFAMADSARFAAERELKRANEASPQQESKDRVKP